MKKNVLPGLALCTILCGCGNVTHVRIPKINNSILYSDAEIEEACKTVKTYFFRYFDDCTLTDLYYPGDSMKDAAMAYAEQYGVKDVIILESTFTVGKKGGDGSLRPNSTYDNWVWVLVRDENGKWRHLDHGYG